MQITQIAATIHSQLGVMTWPLSLMSVITLLLLIERSLFLLLKNRTHSKSILRQLYQTDIDDSQAVRSFIDANSGRKNTLSQGICVLLSHKHFRKDLREETVSIWLIKQKQQFIAGLKFLSVIGVISPLVGLLGTVLGLMEMFKGLAETSGSISPSDLADGLGLAMSTTAAGLIIALPAITGAQIMQLWANRIIGSIEHTLNHANLYLEGISFERPTSPVPCRHTADGICDKKASAEPA